MIFFSFRNLFLVNTRVRILFFLSHKAQFFFQNLTLGYMTKTLNQIGFFFPPPKSEYFFSNTGNQSILLENQRLSRACIVHLVIKRTNWSYVKTMSCSGSHFGIPINIKKNKVCKGPSND